MAENEQKQQDTGLLILGELKTISRLLGVINQTITSELKHMKTDIEMCKVNLSKIRKAGPGEAVFSESPKAPPSYVPPGAGG